MAKYLLPGETIPEPPAANPVTIIARFDLGESAAIFDNLPSPLSDKAPRNMEAYDQGRGCILYRTTLPAGPAGQLSAKEARDFAWVFLDGKPVGTMDRRSRQYRVQVPERQLAARLDVLVEAMGHVNFGPEVHDRKGLHAPVVLKTAAGDAIEPNLWQVYRLPLDEPMLAGLHWKKAGHGPAFWRGTFEVTKPADTFLDVSTWGKGVLWVNGRCMGRFWNIGPTQTMYVPGPWLKPGRNEVIVLDLLEPKEPVLAGLEKPILDRLRPELDFVGKVQQSILTIEGIQPVHTGAFAPGPRSQEVRFTKPVQGRQFCLETLNATTANPSPPWRNSISWTRTVSPSRTPSGPLPTWTARSGSAKTFRPQRDQRPNRRFLAHRMEPVPTASSASPGHRLGPNHRNQRPTLHTAPGQQFRRRPDQRLPEST